MPRSLANPLRRFRQWRDKVTSTPSDPNDEERRQALLARVLCNYAMTMLQGCTGNASLDYYATRLDAVEEILFTLSQANRIFPNLKAEYHRRVATFRDRFQQYEGEVTLRVLDVEERHQAMNERLQELHAREDAVEAATPGSIKWHDRLKVVQDRDKTAREEGVSLGVCEQRVEQWEARVQRQEEDGRLLQRGQRLGHLARRSSSPPPAYHEVVRRANSM